MHSNFRLTASATVPLPRIAIVSICITYTLAGLFFRDPWKGEDIIGFSIMHATASAPWHSWLIPKLSPHITSETGPLIFWLGALSIKHLGHLIGELNASRLPVGILFLANCRVLWQSGYLLGKRRETQPFRYAFGGEPSINDFGKTIADASLLILLACFGLAEKSHQTTAIISEIFSISTIILAIILLSEKSLKGIFIFPIGIALLSLSAHSFVTLSIALFSIALCVFHPIFHQNRLNFLLLSLPLSILGAFTWPAAIHIFLPNEANPFYSNLTNLSDNYLLIESTSTIIFTLKNLPLFTWPAWPLAICSLRQWKKSYSYLHIIVPSIVMLPTIALLFLQNRPNNQIFTLLLPSLSILAAFALPTLSQGIINAIDWFNILTFTPTSIFIWLVWCASFTGTPKFLSKNVLHLIPELQHYFIAPNFLIAFTSTFIWVIFVFWRVNRSPQMIWRSAALSGAGTTLIWILLMTLWLPLINYSRSYRMVSEKFAKQLPENYQCVQPIDLGKSQYAAFSYFGKISFNDSPERCNWILRQDEQNRLDPYLLNNKKWILILEGHRKTDRRERFRLYKRA